MATGKLFAEDDDAVSKLLEGAITVLVTTYFTVGTRALPERVVAKILLRVVEMMLAAINNILEELLLGEVGLLRSPKVSPHEDGAFRS